MESSGTVPSGMREVYEWAEAVVFSLAAVVILFTFLFRIVGVEGISMENTLHNADRLIITNIGYTPKQGDIVVFPVASKIEKNPLIKRIIAVEDQKVNIDYLHGIVKVDGKVLNEPYIKEKSMLLPPYTTLNFPTTVPKGKVFVMGDNRNNSYDGRSVDIGFIDKRDILGHVIMRIYPFNRIGPIKTAELKR